MKKRLVQIMPQMFDIKPVKKTGEVDVEKINSLSRVARLKKKTFKKEFTHGLIRHSFKQRMVHRAMPVVLDKKREIIKQVIKNGKTKQAILSNKDILLNKEKDYKENCQPKKEKILIEKSFQTLKEKNTGEKLKKQLAAQETERIKSFFEKTQPAEVQKNKIAIFEAKAREKEREIKKIFNRPFEKSVTTVSPTEIFKEKKDDSGKIKNLKEKPVFPQLTVWENELGCADLRNKSKSFDDKKNLLCSKVKSDFSEEQSVSQIKECFRKYSSLRSQKRKSQKIKEIFSDWRRKIFQQPVLAFASTLFLLTFSFLLVKIVFSGLQAKNEIAVKGKNALGLAAQAQTDFKERNFTQGLRNLELAEKQLNEASQALEKSGGDILSKIPFFPMVSSGKRVLSGGEKTLQAARLIGQAALALYGRENVSEEKEKQISLAEIFTQVHENVAKASNLLTEANTDFEKVDEDDLPKEYQDYFKKTKMALELGTELADQFEKNYQVFWKIAGFDGPKKYLFLFQNNQEIRATGGFIGSYGVLETKDGQISNFYIDDIYNPDGQLKEKVTPPQPIQKISAAWSLHDSNWFPNFPTSAEKAGWFFEKTGGPTVDGVIALTPDILMKILKITGPIDMPEYDTTVDADNFMEKTQYEVEVDYDKELNRPKKFIADLAPKILNRLLSQQPEEKFLALAGALNQSLQEKHILLYSFDYNVQQLISSLGWSGEVLNSDKDYLMVVNSNINGYKTDGVIEEKISHRAEVQNDGSIVDTVKIIRKHNGGKTAFEWWNKVNADYLRVYVPKGSQLLSANGQTREFNTPPLDYDQLGFRRDPQVQSEELSTQIDQDSGTRIYEENNKTVFANWVYVSPQETVEVEYQYLLPFRLDFSASDGIASYSLLAQKQSGSIGSQFSSELLFLSDKKVVWKYPDAAEILLDRVSFSSDLKEDRFWALVAKNQ